MTDADYAAAVAALDALVAENQQQAETISTVAGAVERWKQAHDVLVAENQHLRGVLEHYGNEDHWSADVGDVYTTFTYDGGEALPWKVAALPWKVARAALAGTPSEDTE